MPTQDDGRVSGGSSFYGNFYSLRYARFGSALAAELRREVYGEDLGQYGWRTATEQAEIAALLRLVPDSGVLDVACGAGGPSLALVEHTGCRLTGLDREAAAIAYAEAQAAARGLGDRATFVCLDCSTSSRRSSPRAGPISWARPSPLPMPTCSPSSAGPAPPRST